MNIQDILKHCDHTLLRVDAGADEIRQLCDEAIRYGCASVCIPPCHVHGAKQYMGDRMAVCTVIGFPNGYATPKAKAFEAQDAIRNGADEIDMVANIAMIKDGRRCSRRYARCVNSQRGTSSRSSSKPACSTTWKSA